MRGLSCVGMFVLLCGVAAPLRADLITNGSFETATLDPPGSSFYGLSAGSTAISGWTVIGDAIHYSRGGWEASDGVSSLDLDFGAGDRGGVSTTFATTPGDQIRVTFDMAGNPDPNGNVPSPIRDMRVSAAGIFQDFSFDTTGTTLQDMGWTPESFLFTATSASTTLSFLSTSSDAVAGWGIALDNVSATAVPAQVPEPSSMLLLGMVGGMGMVGRYVRRRRNGPSSETA